VRDSIFRLVYCASEAVVGMKVEWKDSDFSVEKWKLNENVEMKTEFCKTKKKRNSFGGSGNKIERQFPVEQMRKRNFRFRLIWNFRFTIVLHNQSSKSNN
jgi:hypothetical protein